MAGRHQSADVKTAQRLLVDLAKRLETEHPGAAESGREGLDETLTVLTLNLSAQLRRSLATANAAESLLSRTRQVKRNVKRWRNGQMMLRSVTDGVLEANSPAVLPYIDRLRRLDLRSVGPICTSGSGRTGLTMMRSGPDTMEPLIQFPTVPGEGEGA